MTTFIIGYDTVHPSALKPSKANPRKRLKTSDPARYALLKTSLEQGQWAPILVEQSSMTILSGHQRWEVAKELDRELAVCYLRDLTETERKTIMVQSNTTSGYWDLPKLAEFTADLDLPSLALDPVTLDALAPITLDPLPKDEEVKWTTWKCKLPKDAAQRIDEVIQGVCKAQRCKAGTALSYIVEVFAQDPTNTPQHE